MSQGDALDAMVREGWTRDYLRERGLNDASVRVARNFPGFGYSIELCAGGVRFDQPVDEVALIAADTGAVVDCMHSQLQRLTTRARRYLQRTPRCYFPREDEATRDAASCVGDRAGVWIYSADVGELTKERYGAQCADCGYPLYAHQMNVIEYLDACDRFREKNP